MTVTLDEYLKTEEPREDTVTVGGGVALEDYLGESDQQSHDAVTAVTSRDPALVSRERAAANALGTTRIEAENHLDMMEQAIKKNQAREQLKDSPSLTGYLAGHMADAPVLQNDLKAMSSIEQRLRAFGVEADEESGELELTTEAPDVWKMAAQDVAENASKGFKSGSAMTDLGMMWDKARTGRAVVDEEFTRKSKALEADMEPMNTNESWIAEAAQVVGQMARSVVYSANDTAAASGAIIGAGMASGWLAPEATVLGLAMVTGGTMEAMKSTEAGLAYKEMIDAGADPKIAAEAAEAVGVVNATLEVIGLGVFGKAFKPLISKAIERNTVATAKALANPSMLAMVKETFVGFGKGVTAEVSTEVMQEIVNIAGEQYTKEFAGADFDDMTADALYERLMEISEKTFKAMAVLGSAGATVTMAGGARRVYKAREAQAYFEHLNEVMSTSESRQTTPDVTAEAVQQMADDASVPTVYIDAAEFRQVMQENGVTHEQLEQTLPGFAETLDSRADNHEDIEIPMGEYAAKIAGTDMGNALTIHARTNPDALSAKEEMLVRQESTKMIKGLMDGTVTDEDIDQNLGRFEGVSTEHIAELESQYRTLRDQVEAAKGDEKKALQAQSKELRKTILAEKKAVAEQYKLEYDKLKDKYAADLKAADTNGVKTEDDIKREAKYGAWVSVNFARRAGLDPSRVAEVAPKIVSATSDAQPTGQEGGAELEQKQVTIVPAEEWRALKRTVDNLTAEERAVFDEFVQSRPDADRIMANLEKLKDTPWAKQAVEAVFVRVAIRDLMAGREPRVMSMLSHPRAESLRRMLREGEEGLWERLIGTQFIGDAEKAVNNVNGSFINCDPSDDCAKFCYASGGHYKRWASVVKSELIAEAVESDPIRAAKITASQYKSKPEFYTNKALRLFDKGDGDESWIPFVEELNRQGVRVQVFSKRPEFLRRVSSANIRLLSIDASNIEKAYAYPDLPIAFVFSSEDQIETILDLHRQGRIQVVLPVIEGKSYLSKETVQKLRQRDETRTISNHLCPVNSGSVHIKDKDHPNGWVCTKCDVKKGVGCMFGQPTAEVLAAFEKAESELSDVSEMSTSELAEKIKGLKKELDNAIRDSMERDQRSAERAETKLETVRSSDGGVRALVLSDELDHLLQELLSRVGSENQRDGAKRTVGATQELPRHVSQVSSGLGDDRYKDSSGRGRVRGRAESIDSSGHGANAQAFASKDPEEQVLKQIVGTIGVLRLDSVRKGVSMYERLQQARILERNGATASVIWSETGWMRGHDGKWRTEIDDIELKAAKLDKNAVVLLGDVVANEDLFHAYPELKKVRVKSADLATNIAAFCNYKTKTITVNHSWWEQVASETERRATLAHEIQHMIQAIEGFEGGASTSGIPLPSEAVQKVLQPFYRHIRGNTAWKTYAELEHKRALNNDIMFRAQADAELREILEQNESVVLLLAERASLLERVDIPLSVVEQSGVTIQKLSKNDRAWRNLDSLIDLKKYRANRYFKVSGEVEARNVEARLEDPEYRKRLISDTEDVPLSLQITMREAYLEMEKAFNQQAWHASRYRFKRFLSRAIGTGTGFQAHGYGLYFARKKSEAEGYIPVLTSDFGAEISVRGVEYVEDDGLGDTPSVIAAQTVGGQIERAMEDGIDPAESFDRIIEGAVGDIDFMLNDGLLEEDQAAEIIAEIRQITIDDVSYADDDGVLYKVDIPEDNVLLNEDATFEQQPETVQAALRNAFDSLGIDQAELVGMTGEDLYHKLAKALGSDVNASLALNAEGIKGIKYGTEWNENFVIFDDKAINILDMMQEELKEFHDSVERANMQTTGSYSITHNVIKLTPNANLSTFAHEMGHWYLEAIFSVYGENGVSQLLREDVETILKDFGLDSIEAWYALPMKDREVLHERFAFYVEQYLAEGKAPTRQTRTLFERFAEWLKDVYKHFATPGEELDALYKERFGIDLPPMSEEVRRVLDRMVASEKSIEEAKAAAGLVQLFEQKPEGMSDEDWRELNTLRDEAEAEAAGKVFERRARDEKWYKNARSRKLRELQAQGKKIREEERSKIEQQVNLLPQIKLYNAIKNSDVRLWEHELREMGFSGTAINTLRRHGLLVTANRKNVKKYPASTVFTVRDMFSFIKKYETDRKFIADLLSACDREKFIDDLTTKRCLEKHSDFFDQKKMDAMVTEALHTEARSRMLSTELAYLADNKNARSRVYREAAKQAAEALVAKMPIGKVSVKKFLNAQARASRAAAEALKRGDRMGAVMAKRAELVQHEAAMLAIDIEKKLAALKKLKSRVFSADKKLAATHDLDYVAVARSIMTNEGIGVGSPSTGTPSKAIKALDRLKSYDPDKYDVIAPLTEGHGYRGDIDFGTFTVEYAMQVIDDVQQVMKLARDSKTLLLEGRRLNREDVLTELSERFVKVNRTKATGGKTRTMSYGEKFGLKLMTFKSMLTRVENWCIAMDGGESGPFFNYIFLPVRNAVAKFRNTNMDMQDKLLAIVKPMQEKWNAVRDIEAPELGYTFATKQELIGAVAHCGNLSNKHKLLLGGRGEGHKWARLIERPDGTSFVDTSAWDAFFARCFAKGILTKEDMDTIQAVWDLLEETKPLAQSAFKQMYGTYFEEVEATPVVTPVGTYRGGYVPAVTDQSLVPEKSRHDEAKRLTEQDFVSQMPVHKPGFSKSRVPNYTKPLALDIGLLCGHVQEVLKFAVIAPVAQEIGKIISHDDFVTMIEEVNPTWINDMLVPWLKRSYEQTVSDGKSNWFSAKLNDLRGIAGMNIMAGHIANALQQLTGLSIAATKVSPKYLAKAMAELAKGESSIEMMTQMSPVMRARIDDRAQEFQSQVEHIARTGESVKQAKGVINKALAADAALDPARDWVARHAYFLQTCMQAPIDAVVWIGAYKQATDAGRTESEAIAEADSIVSRTQSSFQPEDVAGVEVGGALYRSVLVFYNYFGMQLNLLGESWEVNKHKKQYGKFALDAVLIAAVPSILSATIAGMVTGFDAGDDDEWDAYDALRLLIAEPFKNVVAMIPFGGTAINYGGSKLAQQDVAWAQFVWGDDPYAGRLFGAPVVDMLDGGVSAIGEWMKAAEGDDYNARRAVRGTLDLLSIVTRMPVGALKKPLGYSAGVASGDIQPDSSVEAVQGFLAGRDVSK